MYMNIVAGYRQRAELDSVVGKSKHNVHIHTDISSDGLLKLMTHADIGISHYGITAYEMACVGLPFVAIAHNIEEFEENRLSEYGFCLDAGLCSTLIEGNIASHINILLNDKSIREQLSQKGIETIDANGLFRITNLIIEAVSKRK